MEKEKQVDESWKAAASSEKEQTGADGGEEKKIIVNEPFKTDDASTPEPEPQEVSASEGKEAAGDEIPPVDFINYVASLAYQTMIFLGEVPNPITQKTEKNIKQAKFIIDTLVMMRDKTKGNLSEQEEQLLGGTLYELQMKFVEQSKAEEAKS